MGFVPIYAFAHCFNCYEFIELMKQSIYIAIAICILFLAAFLVGRFTAPKEIQYIDKAVITEKVKYDTINSIALRDKIQLIDSGKIVYIDSSKVIETKAFVSSIDTICKQDTINVKYEYPKNQFYLTVLPRPDTFRTINKLEIRTEIIKIERPIWIDILSHSGAFIIGGGIGYLIGHK